MGDPFEPLRKVPLQLLTLKVAFLVVITSARCILELGTLSTRQTSAPFTTTGWYPTFLLKVNTPFHRSHEVILPDFCPGPSHNRKNQWHRLDICRALKIYLKHTASFQRLEVLFVSFQPASIGARVSPSTIGRWLRLAKGLTLPADITALSTRSAATLAAWNTRAPIEDIYRAATWALPSPFIRHHLDAFALADASFGRRVLQQVAHPSAHTDQSSHPPLGR